MIDLSDNFERHPRLWLLGVFIVWLAVMYFAAWPLFVHRLQIIREYWGW